MKKTILTTALIALSYLAGYHTNNYQQKKVEENQQTVNLSDRNDVINYFLSTYQGKKIGEDTIWLSKPDLYDAALPNDLILNIRGKTNKSFVLENIINFNSENKTYFWSWDNIFPYTMKCHDETDLILGNYWKSVNEQSKSMAEKYLSNLK